MKYEEPVITIKLLDKGQTPITAISNTDSNLDVPGENPDIDNGGL